MLTTVEADVAVTLIPCKLVSALIAPASADSYFGHHWNTKNQKVQEANANYSKAWGF
jgi:hypothetical protein